MPKLMGRNAAGASFLKGLLKYSESNDFSILVDAQEDVDEFRAQMLEHRPLSGQLNVIDKLTLSKLSGVGGLYIPGPDIGKAALERSIADISGTAWALCGITHTTSSARAMDAIAAWITAPVQEWDAVICTSTAVKKNVETILQAQVDVLKDRLQIQKIIIPRLPVIPIGIHSEDFAFTEAQRNSSRQSLQVHENEIVILYTGRLSFHAKAHPLAMYQALEVATKETGKKLTLIECGWHANQYIEEAYITAAKYACPSVRVVTLDGRDKANRDMAWSSADIFCSLSDNIQETFGIVPIEGMASGLPVIVSDWDGYRDSVRNGVEGFTIPTIAPAPGLAGDVAYRHALGIDTYDMYCGTSSSMVSMQHDTLKSAFVELINSRPLRERMGRAGREKVKRDYDWKSVLPKYEELWIEQSEMRTSSRNSASQTSTSPYWPARLDPTIGFQSYPTVHMDDKTKLIFTEVSAHDAMEKMTHYKELNMVNYTQLISPNDEEILSIFSIAEKKLPESVCAEELISEISPDRRPYALRGLTWLCKLGFFNFK